ncbi:MAG: response regulator, partial [Lewinella sp.]|nr:response regulator [Lewinella sp.]
IDVESEVGVGTVFRVYIPFRAVLSTGQLPEIPEIISVSSRHAQVLVVEDHPINQQLMRAILDKLGYRNEVVNNGQEALRLLEEKSFDLIFMDVQMPVMDGYKTTKAIISRFGSQKRPVIIAMTANALQGDREKCLEAGMDDYITKPVQASMITERIRIWIGSDEKEKSSRQSVN